MARLPQPAKKSYFFEKGYLDLWNTVKGAWTRNLDSVSVYKDNITAAPGSGGKIKVVGQIVINVMAMVAVLVFGSLLTVGLSLLNVAVLLLFMLFVYIGFTLAWAADRVYLLRKRIFTACHECKERMLIPTYLCPKCGVEHTSLTSGVYGILRRTCTGIGGAGCGQVLPTTFFTVVDGKRRRDHAAICANPDCKAPLTDRESVPICIPIVGGRSVGKTAFITAFSHDFISKVAPAKGWGISPYNSAKQQIYNRILSDYSTGDTTLTERQTDITKASSVSFSFFVNGPEFEPDRLVHVYDIAGEVFTDNIENEMQRQYEFCHGIVLVIDPFAIPDVRARLESQLTPEDVAGIGTAEIGTIIDAFLNKLREVTGLRDNEMSATPLAVVISKIDSAGLFMEFSPGKIKAMMAQDPERYNNQTDIQDYLCRKFLKDNGMGALVNSVNLRFRNNRFFPCSAIGHTRNAGAYNPKGIMQPMEWIFRNADPVMAKLWTNTPFTQKPFARAMTEEEL